jgi:hypothetical protein
MASHGCVLPGLPGQLQSLGTVTRSVGLYRGQGLQLTILGAD